MMTLTEFEAQLERALTTVVPRIEVALVKFGELPETMAAAYIGHEMDGWAPLAASTIEDKISKGFPVPHPLLRTGGMRDTISKELDPAALAIAVGSKSLIALYQEMGTSRGIPPRSFLGKAMMNSLPHASDVFGHLAVSLLTGRP